MTFSLLFFRRHCAEKAVNLFKGPGWRHYFFFNIYGQYIKLCLILRCQNKKKHYFALNRCCPRLIVHLIFLSIFFVILYINEAQKKKKSDDGGGNNLSNRCIYCQLRSCGSNFPPVDKNLPSCGAPPR